MDASDLASHADGQGRQRRPLGLAAFDPFVTARVEGASGGDRDRAGRLTAQPRRTGAWSRALRDSKAFVYGWLGALTTSSAAPNSTISPRYITAIRSATKRAAARSWVTNMTAMPSSRRRCCSRLSTVAASDGVERRGRLIAQQQGWRHDGRPGEGHPLALAAGERGCLGAATSAGSPTRASAASTCWRRSRRVVVLRSRSPTISPTVNHGVREAPASWKTICGCLSARSSVPPSGSSSPATTRSSVDFPEPDSPTMATDSPACTSRVTPRSACSRSRRNAPRGTRKSLRDIDPAHRGRRRARGRDGPEGVCRPPRPE